MILSDVFTMPVTNYGCGLREHCIVGMFEQGASIRQNCLRGKLGHKYISSPDYGKCR